MGVFLYELTESLQIMRNMLMYRGWNIKNMAYLKYI
jgi:hypothetical protein